MEKTSEIRWGFFEKLRFILTYAFSKLRVFFEVSSPRFKFFAFELRYSVTNLINTVRLGSLGQVSYFGPELLRTRFGTFRVRQGSQDAAIVSPAFERQDTDYLRKVLTRDFSGPDAAGVLDIGANIGVYSVLTALASGPQVKVWAFEPVEDNRKILNENLRLNSLGQDRVSVMPYALGNANQQIEMHYSKSFPGHASSYGSTAGDAEVLQVELRRADELLPALPAILLIKIDVEGNELETLRGMTRILKSTPKVWLCIEDVSHRSEIYDMLIQLGFQIQTKLTPYNSWWKHELPS